jgi:hypothetical protein
MNDPSSASARQPPVNQPQTIDSLTVAAIAILSGPASGCGRQAMRARCSVGAAPGILLSEKAAAELGE